MLAASGSSSRRASAMLTRRLIAFLPKTAKLKI